MLINFRQAEAVSTAINEGIYALAVNFNHNISEAQSHCINKIEGLGDAQLTDWRGKKPPKFIKEGKVFISLLWVLLVDGMLKNRPIDAGREWFFKVFEATDLFEASLSKKNFEDFLKIFEESIRLQSHIDPPSPEEIAKTLNRVIKDVSDGNGEQVLPSSPGLFLERDTIDGLMPKPKGQTASSPVPFQVPMLPPQGIYGREEEIKRIASLLALDNEQIEDIPPVALRGMGGIGKTTLSIAFGRLEIVSKHFPDGVLWTSLGPNPLIRLHLDAWGRALGVDLLPEHNELACQEQLRTTLHKRRMLLIVDDVWNTIHGSFFQIAGPKCRIIFTTREIPIAHYLATQDRTFRVDILKPEPALSLLRRLAPQAVAADEKIAAKLCERMEFLPLGLTLAGRFLANEADIPQRMQRLIGELIERRESRLKLLQAEGRSGIDDENPVSLQAILGMSVDRLDRIDQERFAALAVFGGDPLTWEINSAKYMWQCSIEDAEHTVSQFIQRGLVERRGERYWMHALLADYAQELMKQFKL